MGGGGWEGRGGAVEQREREREVIKGCGAAKLFDVF